MLYLTFALSVMLLIISPGPVVSLVISEARYNMPKGVIVGAVLSSQILLGIGFFIIFNSVSFNGNLLRLGQVVGGTYLLYIAFSSLYKRDEFKLNERGGFIKALQVGLSNPKDILFFVAFLPSFIQKNEYFFIHAVILMFIWLVIDMSIMIFYSYFSSKLFNWNIGRLFISIVPNITIFTFGAIAIYKGMTSIS